MATSEQLTTLTWSVVMEDMLVEMWAERPVLYDVNSAEYSDRAKKHGCLSELAFHFEMTGSDIGKYFKSEKKTAVVIISADLAHTHFKDGPYGYSDAAQPFDDACGKWVENLDEQSLTKEAASYVIKAKSCGYTGLVMLQGLLSASSGGITSWQSQLYANYHPSYYGMMVASFLRK